MPNIHYALNRNNIKYKIIDIGCLSEIKKDYGKNLHDGILAKKLYKLYLESMSFDYEKVMPGAKSILIISSPDPMVEVGFTYGKKNYRITIPPTYGQVNYKNVNLKTFLKNIFNEFKNQLIYAKLPQKYLAVRSGLAKYGRNNICYDNEFGSYLTINTFLTDIEIPENGLGEFMMMDECRNCTKCLHACPTKAIDDERFIIHADKCLTFINETTDENPGELRKNIHNSWIGCMNCQIVCPMNEKVKNYKVNTVSFTEDETEFILKRNKEEFPKNIIKKFETLNILEYSNVLSRNLRLLIKF